MTLRRKDAIPGELEMPPDQMLELARLAASRVVERIQGLADEPAWRGGSREELEALMRESAPEEGRPPEEVIERAAREILPVAGRVDHPKFFAFVPSSPTWPGVLADFMAAGHNVFQGTWLGASGPSQLELVVIDWFREWLGYPESAGGLFTSGGSAASLDAFVAAREVAGAPERATVYMSDQSHTALSRAATIVGVRPEYVRKVPSDGQFRMDEAGCLMVKDVRSLEDAFSVSPEYLQDTRWGRDHWNFGDRGLQLSRSFRALKVWMSIQTFGMAAFRRAIARGIELAEQADDYVRASDILQIANPASLGIVCFRVNPLGMAVGDGRLEEVNKSVQARVIETGTAMMSSTRLLGLYSLRLCILNHNTRWVDVRETLEAIERFGLEALGE